MKEKTVKDLCEDCKWIHDDSLLEAARLVVHHNCKEDQCPENDCYLALDIMNLQAIKGCGWSTGHSLQFPPKSKVKEKLEGKDPDEVSIRDKVGMFNRGIEYLAEKYPDGIPDPKEEGR